MPNEEHLNILNVGVKDWKKWRANNLTVRPDLSGTNLRGRDLRKVKFYRAKLSWVDFLDADLRKANLRESECIRTYFKRANLSGATFFRANLRLANFREADLSEAKLNRAKLGKAIFIGANFKRANLKRADFSGANLSHAILEKAHLGKANLRRANLNGADLSGANLRGADLIGADLSKANLEKANLSEARLIGTKFNEANLTNCRVFGISAWRIKFEGAYQTNLIITQPNEPIITVDNLEVAQFVYLLLYNKKIRNVIDTIGEKGVLILGRFTEERKAVLDAIRDCLRKLGFVPMMFDFEKPTQRDFTETIKTLAGLSRFIIADITNPKSSPLELQATMPDYMIPFVPIIQEDEEPFAMYQDLQQKYGDWVLDILRYDSADNLLKVLDKAVVKPALEKADELLIKKAEGIRDRHVKDYI